LFYLPFPSLQKRGNVNKLQITMRSISKIVVCLITVIFCSHAFAAEPSAPKDEIAAIESAYRSSADLTAKFVQTTEVALVGRTVTKRGIFQFKKGGKLRIEYEGKDGKRYVSDGNILWTYIPGDEASLQTFAVNDKNVPKEALSFMSGFGKLTHEFKVSGSSAFADAPAGSTPLHLQPRSKNPTYESLEALFGPSHMLIELVVKNTSGNVSRYKFSDIKTNTGLADNIFTLSSGKATPDTLPE